MKEFKTIWFEGEKGPKVFSADYKRIQIHEFAIEQQVKFFEKIQNNFKEKEGVYILLGEEGYETMNENDQVVNHAQKVYVGEAEDLRSRLKEHSKSKDKEFTSRILLITSKDQTDEISKNQLHYFEKDLIRKFLSSDYDVQNRNNGQGNMTDVIQILKLKEELEVIHTGLESLGVYLKDNTTKKQEVSSFVSGEQKAIEIYTNIPNTKINIYATLNADKTITIKKDQTISHKSRPNEWCRAAIDKALKISSMDNDIEVSGDREGYVITYLNDVTYKSFSSALYLIKGGIDMGAPSWKDLGTKQKLR